MSSIFTKNCDGTLSWKEESGDYYVITGITRMGRRFRIETKNWMHASGINLWRGSKWLVRGGKRRLISRTYN